MKNYRYTAIMLNGKKTKGVIIANDFNDARQRLKEKKIRVLVLSWLLIRSFAYTVSEIVFLFQSSYKFEPHHHK